MILCNFRVLTERQSINAVYRRMLSIYLLLFLNVKGYQLDVFDPRGCRVATSVFPTR